MQTLLAHEMTTAAAAADESRRERERVRSIDGSNEGTFPRESEGESEREERKDRERERERERDRLSRIFIDRKTRQTTGIALSLYSSSLSLSLFASFSLNRGVLLRKNFPSADCLHKHTRSLSLVSPSRKRG